jgi:phosphoglycerate dehydrogenase-like enzyme
MTGLARPRVVVTMPSAQAPEVLTPAALNHLRSLADVAFAGETTAAAAERLGELLAKADIVVSGWGAPPLTAAHLDRAPRLRLIAHTAGSIRRLVPEAAFERGIVVCHAAAILADAVAETVLLLTLACLRDLCRLDQGMRAGKPWRDLPPGYAPRQLAGKALGVIGGGHVARTFLRLLRPFELTVRIYDPYLPPARAVELGAALVDLDDLCRRSDIVSVHAPATPETRHLIGARQLRLLPDGAVLINTARASVIDQEALLGELQTGRIRAGLDVFEPEPLPPASPLRRLDNVVLTPHVAGRTVESRQRQGWAMVEEIGRFLAGEPLRYRVPPEQYAIMA